MKSLITFGIWITVSNIINPILIHLDRFLIGSLRTMEAVTFYTAPYEIVTKLWIFPISLVITTFPVFSSLGKKQEKEIAGLYARSFKYLSLIMGIIVLSLSLFAREILSLWLGTDFAQNSSLVFQILAIGVFFNSLARIPSSLIQGIGRPDIPAKFHLLELPLYLIIAFFLIGKLGIKGAALAWTLRVGLDALLLFGASLRLIPQSSYALTKNGMWKTGITLIGSTIAFIFAIVFIKILVIKILFYVVLTAVYILTVRNHILDLSERKAISSLSNRFRRSAE
jgi:O-antigen/teichoic acid export membrane protein